MACFLSSSVHNSFISDCICPHRCSFCLTFLSLSLYSVTPPSSITPPFSPSPSLSSPSFPLAISLSPSVPSYEIKYESIIHSFKHIYHRRVPHCALICKAFLYCASVICQSHGPIWKHHKTGECFLAAQALTRVVRKNPFRGFSCHNNSSASLK